MSNLSFNGEATEQTPKLSLVYIDQLKPKLVSISHFGTLSTPSFDDMDKIHSELNCNEPMLTDEQIDAYFLSVYPNEVSI